MYVCKVQEAGTLSAEELGLNVVGILAANCHLAHVHALITILKGCMMIYVGSKQ